MGRTKPEFNSGWRAEGRGMLFSVLTSNTGRERQLKAEEEKVRKRKPFPSVVAKLLGMLSLQQGLPV